MTKRRTPGNAAPNEVRPPAGHPENPGDGGEPGVGPLTDSGLRGEGGSLWRDPDQLPGGPWCVREVRHGVVCALPDGHEGSCREGQLFGIAGAGDATAERETIDPPPPVEVSCPFCGGVARVAAGDHEAGRVRCDDCGALGPDRLGDDAVTAWNDRSGPRGGA